MANRPRRTRKHGHAAPRPTEELVQRGLAIGSYGPNEIAEYRSKKQFPAVHVICLKHCGNSATSTEGHDMNSLLNHLFGARPPKPIFAEDENAERIMRIVELKWLLREITERPDAGVTCTDDDSAAHTNGCI